MNRKPPELPNIEDATLRACLAPLMEVMNTGGEMAGHAALPDPVMHAPRSPRAPAGCNDNPLPSPEPTGTSAHEYSGTPRTLAEWRLLADDEFGAFRMVELFLAMSDAELLTAAADFPKQIGRTVTRIERMKRRLASQYDAVTAAVALLQRALARAAADARVD